MIRSRVIPVDDAVDVRRAGHVCVLTGGAGSGKTECALRFANAGLQSGQRVAMLVHASAGELRARAARLGTDLRGAVADGRLLLLRYRPDFPRRLAHAASADEAIDDLRRQILDHRPQRIVIDTFAPLLDDGSASALPATSITELLELCQSAALLTYPSDLANGYDRRLEPLLHRAAAILRLVRTAQGDRCLEVVSRKDSSATLPEPLASMIVADRSPPDVTEASFGRGAGRLLFLRVTESPSDDLLAALQLQHEVVVRSDTGSVADIACDGLVIEADHGTLEPSRAVIRARQSGGRTAPIVVATRFTLRSLDRARLLRDGADEVLAGDMGMPELLQRLASAIRRGHLARPPVAIHEDETLTQRALALPGELLDRDRFAVALRARTGHDDAVPFAVLRLTTEPAGTAELRALGEVVLGSMRVNTGDLAAHVGDAIAVCLHGAGRRDIDTFLDRLRSRRAGDAAALRVTTACYPAESIAVRQLVSPLEVG